MKTSKKLLSLFLAVVMAVTSCSVGMTAFASESDKSIWTTEADSKSTYAALNQIVDDYLPALLNIDVIKNLLQDNLGMTVTEDTSLQDVLVALSPVLVNAVGAGADKSTIIPNYDGFSKHYYAYLEDTSEDASSSDLDFYALYSLCKSGLNSDNAEFKSFCETTFPILEEQLNTYNYANMQFAESYSEGMDTANSFWNEIVNQNFGGDNDTASSVSYNYLSQLKVDGVTVSEFTVDDSKKDGLQGALDLINSIYAYFGIDKEVKTLFDAAYFFNSLWEMPIIVVAAHFTLCELSGTEIFYKEGTPALTLDNYKEVLKTIVPFESFMESFFEIDIASLPDEEKAVFEGLENDYQTFLMYTFFNDTNSSYGDFTSPYYYEATLGALTLSGSFGAIDEVKEAVASREITDEQILKMIKDAHEQDWLTNMSPSILLNYLESSECPLSDEARRLLKNKYHTSTESEFNGFATAIAKADESQAGIDDVKSYKAQGNIASNRYKLGKMTIVDAINYMIPSLMCIDEYGDTIQNTDFDDAVDLSTIVTNFAFFEKVKGDLPYGCYDYTDFKDQVKDEYIVDIANNAINSLAAKYLTAGTKVDLGGLELDLGTLLNDTINGFLGTTNFNVLDLVTDIYSDLYSDPVETLFGLVPVLIALVDELLIPLVFVENDPFIYSLLNNLGVISDYTQESGSEIGIGTLNFDLNKVVPAVMKWLEADENYTFSYYDITVNEDGSITYGKNIETGTYNLEKTPIITNIYWVDQKLQYAKLSDLPSKITEKLNEGIDADLTADEIKDKKASNAVIGTSLGEAITELAYFFSDAVDKYVAEHSEDVKLNYEKAIGTKGMNNLFVAIPQILDYMGKAFVEKYELKNADGTPSDWTYLYDGKMSVTEEADENGIIRTITRNNTLESMKGLIDEGSKGEDVLAIFIKAVTEDWLGALLDLVGDLTRTDELGANKITSEIPIVSGILAAFDLLGEKSILTDVLNSVFQLTRENEKYSFSFEAQENTNYVALDTDNVYFLITNLPRLIEVIMNMVNSPSTTSTDNSTESNTVVSKAKANTSANALPAASAKANSSSYSSKDLSNATDLINNLDKMLSSILADVTLNDFSLNKTDNIIASLVTFLSNYLGEDFSKNENDIVRLIDSYLYYITGAGTLKAGSDKNVDAKKVYTNDTLTGLVVETYSLVEKLASSLTSKFNATYDLGNGQSADYNLLAEAVSGIISPDVVSIRLEGDYDNAANKISKFNSWTNMAAETSRGGYSTSIDWNVKAGDKDAFFDGLAASLRVLTSLIGVLIVDTGWYDTVVTPVLGAFCNKNGITLTSIETLIADKEATGYYDETLIAIITPVSEFINSFLSTPATTLIRAVQGLAGILDDKNGATLASIVDGALAPIVSELHGVANILDSDISGLTPTGADAMRNIADNTIGKYADTDKNGALVNIKIKNIALSGANLIPIINTYLADTGITLSNINWNKLSTAATPAAALVYFLEYVMENAIDIIANLLDLGDLLDGLTAQDIIGILNQILEATDSPTMAYWTFTQYLQERATGFKYPAGITAAMANEGVESLDQMVAAIFPLLSSFGLDIGNDLQEVLDKNLFTNSILTQLATALYGALDGLDPTIKSVLNGLGIVTSTKDVAKLLTDKSYGATYSSAAKAISAQSSWSKVKNVNWGFKDGSSNAQQGFVNALVAILRPVNDVLAVFLNEGTLHIDDAAYEIICSLSIASTTTSFEFNIGDAKFEPKITYSMKNGVLTLTVKDANSKDSKNSTLKIDFKSIKELNDLKLEGTNAYNSSIIPLLEALQCSNVKTYAQYQKDVAKAKDNLLLDVLNPLFGSSSSSLLSKLVAAPATTLTDLLPNIAMFIDGNGLVQLVTNLLAPVTYAINDGKNPSNEIGEIIEALLGAPIQDMFIPLINGLLEDIGIVLPDIDWAFLASLGDASSYKSKAVDANGKYITGKTVDADNGKVLVTVLRYVAEVLINNSKTIKNLIVGIDAVKNNDLIASIVRSVFNTIGTASKDELVCAVFYLLSSNPTNAFWDYTKYETGSYTFTYPEGVDVDFLKNLPPMLDGLIGGLLDLNGLIAENLFKDSIISSLATGLYGAIEGVNINDDLNLAQLLAQTDIDFSTDNVAKLLVDEDYGQTYESAASVIKAAGSWKNVNADSLKWGVTDRDSFFHALVAVLRPIYGVLDVLLNDAYLGLFDIVRIPGSNGYSSSIVPLMEAFSMYNIKTQYQYRQDMEEEYDAILLDIINPLWDLVEDVLNAPIQTIAKIVPNLALFIGNDGLCQIIENLFTPISALADAIRPIVDLNSLLTTVLDALDVDLNSILGKVGVTNFSLDLYDLKETLKPLLGADSLIPLINNILPMIKIGGSPLGLKLNPVDWLQLASHGTTVVSASQAATFGSRIYVEGDSSETLIAVLKYLIITINTGENYDVISNLIGGLIGGADSDMSGTISQVLTVIKGDTDTVIASLVELLQTIA